MCRNRLSCRGLPWGLPVAAAASPECPRRPVRRRERDAFDLQDINGSHVCRTCLPDPPGEIAWKQNLRSYSGQAASSCILRPCALFLFSLVYLKEARWEGVENTRPLRTKGSSSGDLRAPRAERAPFFCPVHGSPRPPASRYRPFRIARRTRRQGTRRRPDNR